MALLVLLVLLVCPGVSLAGSDPGTPARVMVLTFDDLPAQRAQSLPEERIQMITRSLLEILERQQIPAIGFVNEDKLYKDGEITPSPIPTSIASPARLSRQTLSGETTTAQWVQDVAGIEE